NLPLLVGDEPGKGYYLGDNPYLSYGIYVASCPQGGLRVDMHGYVNVTHGEVKIGDMYTTRMISNAVVTPVDDNNLKLKLTYYIGWRPFNWFEVNVFADTIEGHCVKTR